jgi:hypothetical protein
VHSYSEVYDFASSAGALEGYLFERTGLDPSVLNNWVKNLLKQYHDIPLEARESFQNALDRTLGRAVLSLIPLLGKEHEHVLALKSMIVGELPDSPKDFEKEKNDKGKKYGE